MMSLRNILIVICLLSSSQGFARELPTFDIDLGGQVVRVPVPEGYQRVRSSNPAAFEKFSGAAPRGMRWEEFLIPSGDTEIDDPFAPPTIAIMVRTGDIGRVLTTEQWREERRDVLDDKLTFDPQAYVAQATQRSNDALRKIGSGVRIGGSAVSSLEAIDGGDERILRQIGVVQATIVEDGLEMVVDSVRVVDILHVKERLLYIAIESVFPQGQPRPWRVTEAADQYITEIYRANP